MHGVFPDHAHHDSTHTTAHAHHGEAPWTMFVPVAVLTLLAVVGGIVAIPGITHAIQDLLDGAGAAPVRATLHFAEEADLTTGLAWLLALTVSLPVALAGVAVAYKTWLKGDWAQLRSSMPAFERILQNGYGFDALYDKAFSRVVIAKSNFITNIVEPWFVRPVMWLVADGANWGADVVSRAQMGYLRFYAAATVVAAIVVVALALTLGS
jgi:NADH-quinone oxidoreductase subunit L